MKSSYKLIHLKSYSSSNHNKLFTRFQTFLHFSIISKSLKSSANKAQQQFLRSNQNSNHNLGYLFNEIVEILGTENVNSVQKQIGVSEFSKTRFNDSELREEANSTQGVCKNVQHNKVEDEKRSFSIVPEVNGELDVSPVVHKITAIVRSENGGKPMEELLESADFEYSLDIVEKVLKRCFKVPHLALRFFNWMKLKEGFNHSTETYNTMIYIAGEAREFTIVEKLIEEMGRNSVDKDIKTWTILISKYGKAKYISRALLFFEEMKKSGFRPPDVKTYSIMLHVLSNAGEADIAMEFYKEMMVQRNMEISIALYQQLLKCFAMSGNVALVYSIGKDMIEVAKIPESIVYGYMLRSFCIAGQIREALELIRDLKVKNVDLDYEKFEILVEGLCRAGRITDALEILDIMKKKNYVNGKVYCIIIDGYLRRNDVSKALDLLQITKDSGYTPTVSTLTNLMQRLIWKNDFEKALETYKEMVDMGVQLDIMAMTAIVVGFIHQKRFSEAWKTFMSVEELGLKVTQKSYNVLIKELYKVSWTDEIRKVLNQMNASKMKMSDILKWMVSYKERKRDMIKIEKTKQIQKTRSNHLLKEENTKPELDPQLTCKTVEQRRYLDNNLVESKPKCYTEEDLQRLLQVLSSSMDWYLIQEELERCDVQFTPDLVVDILSNCKQHGGAALRFFSWVGNQDGYRHTTESYNMAIKISGRGKDFNHMRSLFQEMKRNGCLITCDTWTIMIMQYGRTGMTDIALDIFRNMKASGCKPNGSTYKFLIVSLCGKKGRKVNDAIKIFQEMTRGGYIPDKELIECYLACLCESGRLTEARSCTEFLRTINFANPLTWSFFIRALCRAGNVDEALEIIDKSGEWRHTLDKYTCGSLVHGLLRKGRVEEALAKVETLKQNGVKQTVHTYTSLIVHFFKEKQISKALEIFKNMKEEEGCQPTIVSYSAIIRGYMDMGKVTDAWEVFNLMRRDGPFPDFKAYSMFIACLCRTGESEEALRLLSEMLIDGIIPSTVNFRTVFYGLNREGKQELAQTVLQKKWELRNSRKLLTS